MEFVARSVLSFIRHAEDCSIPLDRPTVEVLGELRAYLDGADAGWREKAFGGDADAAVVVEFHLRGGRVVRGAVAARPSAVGGEAE